MSEPYLVVSTDAHAGPSVAHQLRDYCPAAHLDDFDRFVAALDADHATAEIDRDDTLVGGNAHVRLTMALRKDPSLPQYLRDAFEVCQSAAGLQDPDARRAHMDEDGVAVDVILAGGDNGETLPFAGLGIDAGSPQVPGELKAVGGPHLERLARRLRLRRARTPRRCRPDPDLGRRRGGRRDRVGARPPGSRRSTSRRRAPTTRPTPTRGTSRCGTCAKP